MRNYRTIAVLPDGHKAVVQQEVLDYLNEHYFAKPPVKVIEKEDGKLYIKLN